MWHGTPCSTENAVDLLLTATRRPPSSWVKRPCHASSLWQLSTQASKEAATTGNVHILKHGGVSIRLHVWVLEFKFHVIFTSWNSYLFDVFQPLKMEKPSLTGWVIPEQRVLVAQLCLTCLWPPWTSRSPWSSVHGTFQARVLGWVAIPFSGGSSWLRNRTWVSWIAGRFFIVWATRVDFL